MIPFHELAESAMFGEICVPSSLEAYLIYSDISTPISSILMWLRSFPWEISRES